MCLSINRSHAFDEDVFLIPTIRRGAHKEEEKFEPLGFYPFVPFPPLPRGTTVKPILAGKT